VTLAASDGAGGSGVAGTEYSLDGAAFRPYAGPFTVSSPGGHLVEYRSIDAAGNRENTKDAVFAIAGPQGSSPPALDAFVALASLPDRLKAGTLARKGLRVRATCVSVGVGTVRLMVSKAVARRLGLKSRTLASRRVRCGDDLKVNAKLEPSRKIARTLRRARGTFNAVLTIRMSGQGGRANDTERMVLRGRKRGG
jgi:hypothetical protein